MDECKNIEDGTQNEGKTTLASIRSKEEQDAIAADLSNHAYWLGGVQIGPREVYWFSNTKLKLGIIAMNYTNWHSGEPEEKDEYSCIGMGNSLHGHGGTTWYNYGCHSSCRGLCELRF